MNQFCAASIHIGWLPSSEQQRLVHVGRVQSEGARVGVDLRGDPVHVDDLGVDVQRSEERGDAGQRAVEGLDHLPELGRQRDRQELRRGQVVEQDPIDAGQRDRPRRLGNAGHDRGDRLRHQFRRGIEGKLVQVIGADPDRRGRPRRRRIRRGVEEILPDLRAEVGVGRQRHRVGVRQHDFGRVVAVVVEVLLHRAGPDGTGAADRIDGGRHGERARGHLRLDQPVREPAVVAGQSGGIGTFSTRPERS